MRRFASVAVVVASLCGGSVIAARVPAGSQTPAGGPGAATEPGSAAASGVIVGRVVDALTSRPIAGATVSLGGNRAITMAAVGLSGPPPASLTTAEGYFLFRDLDKSTYMLSATAPGYLAAYYGQRRPGTGPPGELRLDGDERITNIEIRLGGTRPSPER